MRYSIMLQLVGITTSVLLATAGLFAWLQNRPGPSRILISQTDNSILTVKNSGRSHKRCRDL